MIREVTVGDLSIHVTSNPAGPTGIRVEGGQLVVTSEVAKIIGAAFLELAEEASK